MKRKLVLTLLTLSMLLGSTNLVVFAEEVTGPTGGMVPPTEVILTNEERVEEIKNDPSLTEDEKEEMIFKITSDVATYAFSPKHLGIKYFKQKYNYYCGPATVYQTLYYLNKTSPSQDTIASALGTTTDGTDGSKIPTYLNKQQDEVAYTIVSINNASTFRSKIDSAMNNDYPVVLRVKFSSDSAFGYNTAGHFLNLGGQTAGATQYEMVDPYYGYSSGPSSSAYSLPSEDVYQAVIDHFAHHIYL